MHYRRAFTRCLFLVAGLLLSITTDAYADVHLPGFFGDSMVLQQQMPIKVWGWADAGETVTVSIGDESQTTTAGKDGKWRVELPAREASKQPVVLTVKGNNEIEINDVLVGEVWLCSGQSNMEWNVQRSSNAQEEIASADHPLIRHIKFAHRPSMKPLDDIKSEWQICSPATVANFTAVGYFMARRLKQELDIPIGLINSSWGGTRVEPWTPPVGFKMIPALKDIYQSVLTRTVGTEQYQRTLQKHIKATQQWLTKAKQQQERGERVSPSPPFPENLQAYKRHQQPTMLYNGMIHAIVGYPMRGAIWYQGESNHTEGMLYYEKKKALIKGWRKLWGQGDFPFYFVQIAPFRYGDEDPEILARFWEAQSAVTELPNTAMVVINDIATLGDIHPPNKQDVGLRLANLALKHDYGCEEIIAQSPQFEEMEIVGKTIHVHFSHSGGGLKTRDGEPPTHFEIIGTGSKKFQPADAKIKGDKVILSADGVQQPMAFRFAWHKLAEPNLTGGSGLPVGAFRGGKVPKQQP